MRGERGRGGDGVRWVDKEMGGLGMWKALRMGTGRQLRMETERREGAEDGDGKVQGIRRKMGRRFFRPVPFTIFRQR